MDGVDASMPSVYRNPTFRAVVIPIDRHGNLADWAEPIVTTFVDNHASVTLKPERDCHIECLAIFAHGQVQFARFNPTDLRGDCDRCEVQLTWLHQTWA